MLAGVQPSAISCRWPDHVSICRGKDGGTFSHSYSATPRSAKLLHTGFASYLRIESHRVFLMYRSDI